MGIAEVPAWKFELLAVTVFHPLNYSFFSKTAEVFTSV